MRALADDDVRGRVANIEFSTRREPADVASRFRPLSR
jgi:hypothetical protein